MVDGNDPESTLNRLTMSSGYLTPRPDPALLSIVVPCYNEEPGLPLLASQVTQFIDASPIPSKSSRQRRQHRSNH